MNDKTIVGLILLAVFMYIPLLLLCPIITIWSLNAVFGLEIAYSFKTWFATMWLLVMMNSLRVTAKKENR